VRVHADRKHQLDRLEAKELVGSQRLLLEGASRRVFAVTRPGAQALVESRELRERLWTGSRQCCITPLSKLAGGADNRY
jgi:hypothetical protein